MNELSQLTKSCIRPLLIAIDRFIKSGYTQDEISRKNLALQDAYIKASSQFSEYKSEIHQLKTLNLRLSGTIAAKSTEIEELKISRENMRIKLVKTTAAMNCKCKCRCGARRTDENEEDFDDVKELKSENNKLKEEKKFYSAQLEEKVERLMKIQLEMEVSEERFIRSRAFKSLVSQAKNIAKSMESLKRHNDELQRINDDFNENKYKEIRNIQIREEEKRSALEVQIQSLHSKMSQIEKDKDEAISSLNLLKKEKVQQRTSVNYNYIIEDLEEERTRLKKQSNELNKEKNDLANRLEEEQRKNEELKDQAILREIEISKMSHEDFSKEITEDQAIVRLKEYRNEVDEFRSQIKLKDYTITRNESAIRQLKTDLKSEMRKNETLIKEIELTGNAYDETMKKNKSLASQLVDQDQNIIQLMNERLKENNWKMLMEKQQSIYEEQLKSKESLIMQLQDVLREEQKLSNGRLESNLALEGKFRSIEQKLSTISSSHNESTRKYEELLNCKKELQEKLREAEKLCIKNATDCIQYKFLFEHGERVWKENEEKLVKLKESQLCMSNDEIFLAEFTKSRKLIRCSQCNTRNKDCLLTKCLHLYCRRCIEYNLSQRNRKCPSCFTKFTSEDVRTFYWS